MDRVHWRTASLRHVDFYDLAYPWHASEFLLLLMRPMARRARTRRRQGSVPGSTKRPGHGCIHNFHEIVQLGIRQEHDTQARCEALGGRRVP